MNFVRLIGLLFPLVLLGFGCDKIDPSERTPTFLHIDSFQFQATPNTGTASHKITSVWVYFDGRSLGVFDLPATIPVLAEEAGQILMTPGISFTGLTDVQAPYAFYRSDTMNLQPSPGNTVNYTPVTRYIDEALLNITNVDFENGNPFALVDGDTPIVVTTNPDLVFEGSYGGVLHVDTGDYSVNLMQTSFSAEVESFLEMNYKCSVPFQVGLQTTNTTGSNFVQYIVTLKPREDWNKIYIGLQDFITLYPNKSYRVVIRVLNGTTSPGFVALDNIKAISGK